MEFDLADDGTLTPLPSQNIDTGLGVERGAAILQDVHSVYETDGFQHVMDWVAAETGTRYGESDVATKAHRVLADHGRAMTFLVADGVTPSNEGRGYVLRRSSAARSCTGARSGSRRSCRGSPASSSSRWAASTRSWWSSARRSRACSPPRRRSSARRSRAG